MARAPRKLTKTSGQGTLRRGYQTAYSLGMHGTGQVGDTGISKVGAVPQSGTTGTGKRSSRIYTKAEGFSGPMNIAYSEREFKTPNLDALKAVGALNPGKVKF